jgi:hypothetical protein
MIRSAITLLLLMIASNSGIMASERAFEDWRSSGVFEFDVGGHFVGEVYQLRIFGSEARTAVIEQVSVSCVLPGEAIMQNISIGQTEDGKLHHYEMNISERPTLPNGKKTIVVSQSTKIRLRLGQGEVAIWANIWMEKGVATVKCAATIGGRSRPSGR